MRGILGMRGVRGILGTRGVLGILGTLGILGVLESLESLEPLQHLQPQHVIDKINRKIAIKPDETPIIILVVILNPKCTSFIGWHFVSSFSPDLVVGLGIVEVDSFDVAISIVTVVVHKVLLG